jgi:hypothetical protein
MELKEKYTLDSIAYAVISILFNIEYSEAKKRFTLLPNTELTVEMEDLNINNALLKRGVISRLLRLEISLDTIIGYQVFEISLELTNKMEEEIYRILEEKLMHKK